MFAAKFCCQELLNGHQQQYKGGAWSRTTIQGWCMVTNNNTRVVHGHEQQYKGGAWPRTTI